MHLSEYERTGPEILQKSEDRTEDGVVANAVIRKVKNVGFLNILVTS